MTTPLNHISPSIKTHTPRLLGQVLHRIASFHSTRSRLTWKEKRSPAGRCILHLAATPYRTAMPVDQRRDLLNAIRQQMEHSVSSFHREIPEVLEADLENRPLLVSALLPTPMASDYRVISLMTAYRKLVGLPRPSGVFIGASLKWHPDVVSDFLTSRGQLNPAWYEWLMGYPSGWTISRSVTGDKSSNKNQYNRSITC